MSHAMPSPHTIARERTFSIILLNCDCSSDTIAVPLSQVHAWKIGPRCRSCGKVLGWMEWQSSGFKVRASDEMAALLKWKERKHERVFKVFVVALCH